MATVRSQVVLDGQPLRRCYVEHIALAFGVEIMTFGNVLTDNNGEFEVDAGPGFDEVDVRVHCHNSVIEVLDDNSLPFLNTGIYFESHVSDGDVIDITSHKNHYRILNICLDVYETVWRHFKPYNEGFRSPFPLGRPSSATPRQLTNRIKAVFPERIEIGNTHYVAPIGSVNGLYPYIHFKKKRKPNSDDNFRPSQEKDKKIIAHEFGHCMHFSALSVTQRTEISTRYLAFLIENRNDPGHNLSKVTSPFVAFIEAIGHFSETFYMFAKSSNLDGRNLRQSFFRNHVNYSGIGELILNANETVNDIIPELTGDDVEGAVYGAIFLDLARKIGLREVVGLVLASGAMSFGDFKTFILNQNDDGQNIAISEVSITWGME